jgi:hypothetical protein
MGKRGIFWLKKRAKKVKNQKTGKKIKNQK